MTSLFENKKILVTGGAGSIGSAIVRELLQHNPNTIRVLDINESALFALEEELKAHKPKLRFLVGDVRDPKRIRRAMESIDIVFHAAALKHVPLCEYNPFEAVKTNVVGTQNVIDACLTNNVKKLIFISTDKAVNPVNVMGASKLLGERLTLAANEFRGAHPVVFSVVRFGNVLASRGSILPLFLQQIKKGGPVTITDSNMVRFIMPIEKAVQLILTAAQLTKGGETFILQMPKVKIVDLAEVMIAQLAPRFNHDPKSIKLQTIGAKKGEKLNEDLTSELEKKCAVVKDNMLIIGTNDKPTPLPEHKLLTKKEIENILKDLDWDSMHIS